MPLGAQALAAFDLPVAPARVDELTPPLAGVVMRRIHAPAGRFLLMWSEAALAVAFEATLFELLAEARFPSPRPRRALDGSMIARLAPGAAACYPWPPGEALAEGSASPPQLMEVGRLLARLHQLGEVHPAKVSDPWTCSTPVPPEFSALPSGAVHGGLVPERALFVGNRCSAVLPTGAACSAPLLLDVAQTAVGWMVGAPRPVAVARAIVSGYQALRRFLPEETSTMQSALSYAAARAGVAGLGDLSGVL